MMPWQPTCATFKQLELDLLQLGLPVFLQRVYLLVVLLLQAPYSLVVSSLLVLVRLLLLVVELNCLPGWAALAAVAVVAVLAVLQLLLVEVLH